MPRKCIICGFSKKSSPLLSFHRFPKDKELRENWVRACCLEKSPIKPNAYLCSSHFREQDYDDFYFPKRVLKQTAIPSPSNRWISIRNAKNYGSNSSSNIYRFNQSTIDVHKNLTCKKGIKGCTGIVNHSKKWKESSGLAVSGEHLNHIDGNFIYNLSVGNFTTKFHTQQALKSVKDKIKKGEQEIDALQLQRASLEVRFERFKNYLFENLLASNLLTDEAYIIIENLGVSVDPYICLNCLQDVTASYDFKRKCEHTENRISAILKSQSKDYVDLRVVKDVKYEITPSQGDSGDSADSVSPTNLLSTEIKSELETYFKLHETVDIKNEANENLIGVSLDEENACSNNETCIDINTFMESLSTQEFYDVCSSNEENEQLNHSGKNKNNENGGNVVELERGISLAEKPRKYFCLFCRKQTTKLPRHFLLSHQNEESVKEFQKYSVGSRKRKRILARLRNEGAYRHYKETGENVYRYDICPLCKHDAMNLSKHLRKCKKRNPGLIDDIHELANKILRENIYPHMKKDSVTTAIKQDKIINLYGNYLSKRMKSACIKNMMRLAGHFLIKITSLNKEITNIESIFQAKFFNYVVKTVHLLAGFDPLHNTFKMPRYLSKYRAMLKRMGLIYLDLCSQDKEQRRQVSSFMRTVKLKLMVVNGETGNLPQTESVEIFVGYMRSSLTQLCNKTISSLSFLEVCKQTLVLLVLVNREAVVEIKKAKLSDVEDFQRCSENLLSPMAYNDNYSYKSFTMAHKGKNQVVVIDPVLETSLNKIIAFRKESDMLSSNDMLFPQIIIPTEQQYLLSSLMEEYCDKCMADNEKCPELKEELTEFKRRLYIAEFHFNRKLIEEAANSHECTANLQVAEGTGENCDVMVNESSTKPVETEYKTSKDMETIDVVTSGPVEVSPTAASTSNIEDGESSNQPNPDKADNLSCNVDPEWAQDSSDSDNDRVKLYKNLRLVWPSWRKTRWTHEEKQAAKEYFAGYFSDDSVRVSLQDCQTALLECKELSTRSIPQLKVWLAEEKKRMQRDKKRDKKGVARKRSWTGSELKCLKKHFGDYIKSQLYPSTEECLQLLEVEPLLKHRTPEIIRSKLQHEYKIIREGKRLSDLE